MGAAIYGNILGVQEGKSNADFATKWSTRILDEMNAYGDYSWGVDKEKFNESYNNNIVLGPILQVIHAIDKDLRLDNALGIVNRADMGGWLNGGKLREASTLLRNISKTLTGNDLAPASTMEEFAGQLSTVWPAIKNSAGQYKFVSSPNAPQAQADFGVFVALITLNPVALVPISQEAQAALQTKYADLWATWSSDKARRLSSTESEDLTHSDTWYLDRAAMLDKLIERNTADAQGILPGTQNIAYIDKTSNTQILVGAGSAQRIQYIFGGSADESIEGQSFADHLYGGAGNDTLSGQGGADYLEGNATAPSSRPHGSTGQNWQAPPAWPTNAPSCPPPWPCKKPPYTPLRGAPPTPSWPCSPSHWPGPAWARSTSWPWPLGASS